MFIVVSIALVMASIDQTIVAVALPTIHRELHAPINWTSWVISAYAVGLVVTMPLAGRTGDAYGRKRVFVGAIILFTCASAACGSVQNVFELIPLRTLQALGGGAFLPSAVGIISDSFGDERDRAIGMTSSILPIGGLVAPTIGGLFIHYWTWRGIFWVNVPIGVGLVVAAVRMVPRSARRTSASTDFAGVALLATGIVAAMICASSLGDAQTRLWSPLVLSCAAASIVATVALVRRSARIAEPLIPLGLVVGRGFAVMNLMNFSFGTFFLGLSALLPLYAQDRYAISPLGAATLLTGRAVGLIGLAVVAAWLLRRVGYRVPIAVGLCGVGAGTLMLATRPVGMSPYWWLSVACLLTGCAFGLAAPAVNNASLSLAPEHVGAITGLRGLFRQTGTIIGVTVPTAVLARSNDPGAALAAVYVVSGVVFLVLLAAIPRVPEHEGAW